MGDFIAQGGPFMYLLLIIGLAVAGLSVWTGMGLSRTEAPDPVLETRIDATLFWGVWALLLGLLGTAGGMYQAAGAISRAGEVAPNVVWGGVQVALTTTLVGLTVFLVAALIWFTLRVWYRQKVV